MTGVNRPGRRLMVVEDEANIRELVCSHLASEGYDCTSIADGRRALEILGKQAFDVVLLDVMLPGLDGLTVCRAVRTYGPNRDVPILILTARREEQDKLEGFGYGADDYLTKPFSMKELTARVAALVRRIRGGVTDPMERAAPIVTRSVALDPARRTVRVRGGTVAVTPHEFRLLYRLAFNPGVVFTRERLLAEIWHGEPFVTGRTVDTLVHRLRCKIEANPAEPTSILTVWGEGYKFVDA